MRRIWTFLLTLLFMAAAIGVDVKAHYCGGVLVQLDVNGFPLTTDEGRDMSGCCDDGGCPSCKNTHHIYKVKSQYSVGQMQLLHPSLCHPDWFHGGWSSAGLAGVILMLDVPQGGARLHYAYRPRSHPYTPPLRVGMRAPPVTC